MPYQASAPATRHSRRVSIRRAGQSEAWFVSASQFGDSVRARDGRPGEDGNLARREELLPAAVDKRIQVAVQKVGAILLT